MHKSVEVVRQDALHSLIAESLKQGNISLTYHKDGVKLEATVDRGKNDISDKAIATMAEVFL